MQAAPFGLSVRPRRSAGSPSSVDPLQQQSGDGGAADGWIVVLQLTGTSIILPLLHEWRVLLLFAAFFLFSSRTRVNSKHGYVAFRGGGALDACTKQMTCTSFKLHEILRQLGGS